MDNTTPPLDRAFSALCYVMPLTSALGAGAYFLRFLSQSAPPLYELFGLLLFPLMPLIQLESNPIIGLGIFILLFAFVVRNENISRFIRFNVLQAILVSFMISIGVLILELLGLTSLGLIGEALLNVFFLGGMAIVVYGIVQSALGRYAEIPAISDAVNMQMPY